MTKQQISTWNQFVVKGFDDFFLCFEIEVDNHVSTHDRVHRSQKRNFLAIYQVDLNEVDSLAHDLRNLTHAVLVMEVLLAQERLGFAERGFPI